MPGIVGVNRLGAGLLQTAYPQPVGSPTIVDATTRFQTIDGFGVSHPWPLVYTGSWSANADAVWKYDGSNIGLSMYNCVFGIDGSGNVGPQYTANDFTTTILGDWSHEQQAYNRGVRTFCVRMWAPNYASPWSYQVGGTQNAAIISTDYTSLSNAMATFFTNAVNNGVYFTHISPWNEPDISPSYPQASWTTAQMLAFIKVLGPILQTWAGTTTGLSWQSVTGLSVPQIVAGEPFDFANSASTYIPAFEGDSTALSYVGVYSCHQYNGNGVSAPPNPMSRKRWQTECYNQSSGWDTTMTDAMNVVGYMYNALTPGSAGGGGVTAWWYWTLEDAETAGNTTTGGLLGSSSPATLSTWNSPTYRKTIYAIGNFSKFVRPKSLLVNTTNAPAGVNILSFILPGGGSDQASRLAIVCMNTNASTAAVTIYLKGIGASNVTPWVTDVNNNLVAQSSVPVVGATFSYTLTASSVTTFVY